MQMRGGGQKIRNVCGHHIWKLPFGTFSCLWRGEPQKHSYKLTYPKDAFVFPLSFINFHVFCINPLPVHWAGGQSWLTCYCRGVWHQ